MVRLICVFVLMVRSEYLDQAAEKMVISCRNFTKTTEACKKKYLAEFTKYKKDKLHNVVIGDDQKITCKFHDELNLHSKVQVFVHPIHQQCLHPTQHPNSRTHFKHMELSQISGGLRISVCT